MQVNVIHRKPDGSETGFGIRELDHMPPVGEPFPLDETTWYTAKAYFGPNEEGRYLLVLEGDPHSMGPH
jgi:hypothetical protein